MRKVPPELGEWVLRRTDQPGLREALSVRVSHRFTAGSARFDEDNLVSHAGLVPLLGLAEQTGLPEIIAGKVSITTIPPARSRVQLRACPPAGIGAARAPVRPGRAQRRGWPGSSSRRSS